MAILYANNAVTTLAGTVSSGATTCTVATGTGALFPSPSGSDYFLMTFSDAATNSVREIVKVTARSTDVMTIVRAQEGTSAAAWAIGDNAQNLWTAGSASAQAQVGQVQAQAGNYAAGGGTANAITATLSPAIASYAAITGAPVRIKKGASANTGAATLNLNGIGAVSIVIPGGAALTSGQLAASGIFTVVYDGSVFELQSGFQTARTGEMFDWPANTPPAYALVRDGSAVSRTTYAGLNAIAAAASYADPWGPGNGSTTFNLPNDLGLFVRGWDSGGSVDPGRGFGSVQGFASEDHTHTTDMAPIGLQSGSGSGSVSSSNTTQAGSVVRTSGGMNSPAVAATETRPINRAYLPCICI